MTRTTPYSAVNLQEEAGVDPGKWNTLPSPQEIDVAVRAVGERGIRVRRAATGGEALAVLKTLIPPKARVMTGSSTTLIEIGFTEYLETGNSGWESLHAGITAEDDDTRRAELRRMSVAADYFVSGVNAIARTGEIVGCDASGSRVGAWPFAAGHLILVSGINKIVPDLGSALLRIQEYAFRLEDARARRVYGIPSTIGKIVILARERNEGRVTLVLADEALGY